MALSDIIEKIGEEAKKRIAELEKNFNEQKAKLEEENKKKQKKIDADMHDKVEENTKKIIEKAETLAEREGKNKLLLAKRAVMEEALNEAIEKLSKSDKYEEIISTMLKEADIDGENIVVVPAKGKEDVTKSAIKNLDKSYFLSEKATDIKGGFILKTDKVEIDNSFETIIKEQLREDLEIKLHKLLF